MSERAQLRSNQLITTFGPGAMVDLPGKSVIIAGLHEWKYTNDNPCIINEPRLAAKVGRLLGKPSVELRSPPPAQDLFFAKGAVQPAVTGYEFPHWFIAQHSVQVPGGHRRRRLVHRGQLIKGRFRDPDANRNVSVVPVRFVRACRKGHVGDLNWKDFAHSGPSLCQLDLWLEERGTSGDLSEIWLLCDCGASRRMNEAAKSEDHPLGKCNGSRAWLDDRDPAPCGEPNRLLLRNASNAYFPQMLGVISIPDTMAKVDEAVLSLWESALSPIKDKAALKPFRSYCPQLKEFSDDDVWESMERVRSGTLLTAVARPVKDVEFERLTSAGAEAITDVPDGDFFVRQLEPSRWQAPWLESLEKVVLVHRLREVSALVGFTRFDPAGPDIAGELDISVERAPLIDAPRWMPASENRGEGVFLHFKKEAIESWAFSEPVQQRANQLQDAFQAAAAQGNGHAAIFPGIAYMMLHSLAHLLMTSISLECGYPASSLRERIYAPHPDGKDMTGCYGILIYTGSSDAQGTLGGLVAAARDIRRHLIRACELAALCSNDPVCSSHQPGVESYSGSACHACLFLSETSCEQFNRYLDRSLVATTIDNHGCEFFCPEA